MDGCLVQLVLAFPGEELPSIVAIFLFLRLLAVDPLRLIP